MSRTRKIFVALAALAAVSVPASASATASVQQVCPAGTTESTSIRYTIEPVSGPSDMWLFKQTVVTCTYPKEPVRKLVLR